jgi:uncharacterized lipoprotein
LLKQVFALLHPSPFKLHLCATRMAVGIAMLLLCSACSKIDKQYGSFNPDRNKTYLSEHETSPLKLPAGSTLNARTSGDRYPIPQGVRPAPGSEPVSIIPPTLTKSVGETNDTTS